MLSLLHLLRSRRVRFNLCTLASCAGLFIVSCGLDQASRLDDHEPTSSSGDDGTGGRTGSQEGTGGKRGFGEGTAGQHSGGTSDGPLGGADGAGGDPDGAAGWGGVSAEDPAAFVTRWLVEDSPWVDPELDGPGDSDEDVRTIRLPLVSDGEYDFLVDWGDGTTGRVTWFKDEDAVHVYQERGNYEVALLGKIQGWSFSGYRPGPWAHYPMVRKLREVKQWGSIELWGTFEGCNLGISAVDAPQLGSNLAGLFSQCSVSFAEGGTVWDTSHVINMSGMFEDARVIGDISGWDTSSVTDMSHMFHGSAFYGDISGWDTSRVTDMSSMFMGSRFDGDISGWDTSRVTDMSSMFEVEIDWSDYYDETGSTCARSTSPSADISGWNTSNVTNMTRMFYSNRKFDGDISGWDTSRVTDMSGMFAGSVFNGDISAWDTSSVESMRYMFGDDYCGELGSSFDGDISSWDTSNVVHMNGMFNGSVFNGDLSNWDTSNVTQMAWMFYNSSFNGDLSNWDTSNVTIMHYMFSDSPFNGDISSWDTSNVFDLQGMFSDSPFNGDISSWDIATVRYMNQMFYGSSALSTENYDKLLQGWAVQDVQPDVSFHAGSAKYSAAAVAARSTLESKGWTISDGGMIE